MKDSTRSFHEAAVEGFSDAIMLRRFSSCKATFSTLLLQIISKSFTSVLTAVIRTKSFNRRTMLVFGPGCEGLVGLEGFIFST